MHGQTAQQQPAAPETQQGGVGGDPIRQLNLTPEQREQIRSIREHNKVERAAINERVRDSNLALEEALNSDNPDEAVVEQRVREVAAAQAAAMRMRILTEVRIRRVLTAEQRIILRSLQQQAKEIRRERLLVAPEERQQRREERPWFAKSTEWNRATLSSTRKPTPASPLTLLISPEIEPARRTPDRLLLLEMLQPVRNYLAQSLQA